MKRWMLLFLCLSLGGVDAAEYSILTEERAFVYDQQGNCLDASKMSVETELSVTYSDSITVKFNELHVNLNNGKSFLSLQNELSDVLSKGIITPKTTMQLDIALKEKHKLIWADSDSKIVGENYKQLENGALELLQEGQLEYQEIFPLAWLTSKVPFLWSVKKDVRIGDKICIPFRPKEDSSHKTNMDRSAEVICVERQNDTVVFESNRQVESNQFLVTWSVRIVFDLQKQQPLSMIENRFAKTLNESSKHTHTVRETVNCRIIQK